MLGTHNLASSKENNNLNILNQEITLAKNNLKKYHTRIFGRELTNIPPIALNNKPKLIPSKPYSAKNSNSSLHNARSILLSDHNNNHNNNNTMVTQQNEEPMIIENLLTKTGSVTGLGIGAGTALGSGMTGTMAPSISTSSLSIIKPILFDPNNYLTLFDNTINPTNSHKQDLIIESINTYNNNNKNFYKDLEPCDREDLENPQCTAIYNKDIFEYFQNVEEKCMPKPGYMSRFQVDINEKMRAILIDWLVDVHLKFKLQPETLFLTVNLIDRYLERVPVIRQKLQLVGVAALLISCKYEEIYAPEVKDLVIVTDNAYNREEILEMEGNILSTLVFKITIPSSFRFLQRFARISALNERAFLFCRYIIEACLIDYKMLKYKPSMIASSAIWIANKVINGQDWSKDLEKNSKLDEKSVKACATDIIISLEIAEKSALTAVRRKFSVPKMMEVSKFKFSI